MSLSDLQRDQLINIFPVKKIEISAQKLNNNNLINVFIKDSFISIDQIQALRGKFQLWGINLKERKIVLTV